MDASEESISYSSSGKTQDCVFTDFSAESLKMRQVWIKDKLVKIASLKNSGERGRAFFKHHQTNQNTFVLKASEDLLESSSMAIFPAWTLPLIRLIWPLRTI